MKHKDLLIEFLIKERAELKREIEALKDELDPKRKFLRTAARNMEREMFNGIECLVEETDAKDTSK